MSKCRNRFQKISSENMAADWGDDDDFFGAGCEMDDQMLIGTEDDNEEEIAENFGANGGSVDAYENELREREVSFSLGRDLPDDEHLLQQNLSGSVNFKYRYFHRRKDSQTLYPPTRNPPIFDFFTVLTAFIVAVILAYYTIASY